MFCINSTLGRRFIIIHQTTGYIICIYRGRRKKKKEATAYFLFSFCGEWEMGDSASVAAHTAHARNNIDNNTINNEK